MQILNALTRVRQLMNSRSLSLAEAVRYTPQLAVRSSHIGVAALW